MFVRIKREREEKVLLEYAQENPILNSLVFSLFPGKFISFFVFSWTQKTKNSKGELKFRESGCLQQIKWKLGFFFFIINLCIWSCWNLERYSYCTVKKVVLNDFILKVFIHFFNCKYSYLFWLMRSSSL